MDLDRGRFGNGVGLKDRGPARSPRSRVRPRIGLTATGALVLAGFGILLLSRCRTLRDGPPISVVAEGRLAALTFEPAFPNLPSFERPVLLTTVGSADERLFVAEQRGVIWAFPNRLGVASREIFLDIQDRVSRRGNEEGLLGLAFDPDFRRTGRFYLYYSLRGDRRSIFSRFRVGADGRGNPHSEERILEWEQPFRNHNGGTLVFGPDGMLYIALGDGGLWGDYAGHAQNLGTHLGSILRIDVRGGSTGRVYTVPPDNPFVNVPGARPEIWAYGLRNPWRIAFDRETGTLWAADVGQRSSEEVDIIVRGGNYGWPAYEGFSVFKERARVKSRETWAPLAVYPREEGASIIGGAVYRGSKIPGLVGAYVFCDFVTGSVWALRISGTGSSLPIRREGLSAGLTTSPGVEMTKIIDSGLPIASFGEDQNGELYALAFDGQIYRLAHGALPERPHPERLSDTGLFADLPDHVPVIGAIPYEVNVPLWADGALKERFIVLPAGGRIRHRSERAWSVPPGTRIVKSFSFDRGPGRPRHRLETRVIRREEDGWSAVTYVWNDAQSDAILLRGGRTTEVPYPDEKGYRKWTFPSRAQCAACHTQAAGFLLGLTDAQFNVFPRSGSAQIQRLRSLGVLADTFPAPDNLTRHPSLGDASATLEARARAYLDANCAFCHRPGAPGNARMDLRAAIPLRDANLIHAEPGQDPLGFGPAARIIRPGDPRHSVLLRRMALRNHQAMPPLGTWLPDRDALDVVERWIEGMR